MSKDLVEIKRKASEIVDYSSLEKYFGSFINRGSQNPEAPLQPEKTKVQECEPPKSSPSNSMVPRDQSQQGCSKSSPSNSMVPRDQSQQVTSGVRNLGL